MLANWLVCVAVWQAGASSSLPGKALGAWLPVSAFVALGLEHSVRPCPSVQVWAAGVVCLGEGCYSLSQDSLIDP